jgi:hypothetical protein
MREKREAAERAEREAAERAAEKARRENSLTHKIARWFAGTKQSNKVDTRLPWVSSRPVPPVKPTSPDRPPPDWPVDKIWTGQRR